MIEEIKVFECVESCDKNLKGICVILKGCQIKGTVHCNWGRRRIKVVEILTPNLHNTIEIGDDFPIKGTYWVWKEVNSN